MKFQRMSAARRTSLHRNCKRTAPSERTTQLLCKSVQRTEIIPQGHDEDALQSSDQVTK